MAAYFIDLDGTILFEGTNRPLPGAMRTLRGLMDQGHQIIFTTLRPSMFLGDIEKVLAAHGIMNALILTDVQSPRVVVNNEGAFAVNHPTNGAVSLKDFTV